MQGRVNSAMNEQKGTILAAAK